MLLLPLSVLLLSGCRQAVIDGADRTVQQLLEDRQRAAIGITSDARTGPETGTLTRSRELYGFTPHPLDAELPEAFRTAPARVDAQPRDDQAAQQRVDASEDPPTETDRAHNSTSAAPEEVASEPQLELSPDIFSDNQKDRVELLGLRDALAYAMAHARELQDAKEDLYLAALDLTLERHLWTPQFVASMDAGFVEEHRVQSDEPQGRFVDRTMDLISSLAVTQGLPYGGEVTAGVTNQLVSDLNRHVTAGESGTMIIEANIPLFRGAGRVAYESRYKAERNLIYAVRTFERFRRAFVVRVAGEYFRLQQSKAAISNAYKSYLSLKASSEKAGTFHEVGRSTVFDALRAKASLRDAEASLVSAKERYESALDRFKIFITMPLDSLLDVVAQEEDAESEALDEMRPNVEEVAAVGTALAFRLDLLNNLDQVDDARREVLIKKNRILPDLDLTAGLTLDTNPSHRSTASYGRDRSTWQGSISLRMDDRKTERNAFREALIMLRRAERGHEEQVDNVRADVRSALRRLAQQTDLRTIQALNVEESELRLEAAEKQYDLGKITNQDVVDAEDNLLAARNRLAAAVAEYRRAILELRRDTGTLRITEDGWWSDS